MSPLQRLAARGPSIGSRSARLALACISLNERSISRFLDRASTALPPPNPVVRGRVVILLRSLASGGVQRQVVYTALGLRRAGFTDIHVIAADVSNHPGSDFFHKRLRDQGVCVHELAWNREGTRGKADPDLERGVEALLSSVRGLRAGVRNRIVGLYASLRELRPEVVHAWGDSMNTLGGVAACMTGIPRILVSGRSLSPSYRMRNNSTHYYPMYRALLRRPSVKLLTNSHAGASDYAAWLNVPRSEVAVVYNAVDLKELGSWTPEQVARFRESHGLAQDKMVVGGLFRHDPQKRSLLWVQTAERVLANNANVCFVMLGAKGKLGDSVQRDIAERGLADHIKMRPATHDVGLALSAMDVFLLTADYEGTPNALIEAQAMGVPVVATGKGGVREAMKEGATGAYVNDPTPENMAQAVLNLLGEEGQRRKAGEAGRAFVAQRFAMDRMIQETIALYGWDAREAMAAEGACRLVGSCV